MSETSYYFGDTSDLEGLTRAEVIDWTDDDNSDYADRYEQMITELYDTVEVGELTWDAGHVLHEMNPIAFRCGLVDLTCEIDLDDYPSDDEGED